MLSIRAEKTEDIEAIRQVNQEAFGQEIEANLVDRIRNSQHFIPELSLVALDGDEIIGHIMFSTAWLEKPGKVIAILALAPMAVALAYQKRGIGSALVTEGLQRAKLTVFPAVVVLGYPDYYPRFGFATAREKGIECPYPAHEEAYMVKELYPGAINSLQGKVKYPGFFDEV